MDKKKGLEKLGSLRWCVRISLRAVEVSGPRVKSMGRRMSSSIHSTAAPNAGSSGRVSLGRLLRGWAWLAPAAPDREAG
ncbi:hypothetical protein MTO96_046089 [Rhipicephalus appendiculatus]